MTDLVGSGVVTSVDRRSVGAPLTDLVPAGEQVLFVEDNVDFSPGDEVLITTSDNPDGELYTLAAVDEETGLTLTGPLLEALPEGAWVAVHPLQFETVATVRMTDSGEVLPCTVLHTLSDALRPGIRDEDTAETVLVVTVDDTRYVFDVVARQTVRDLTEALPGVKPMAPEAPVLTTTD